MAARLPKMCLFSMNENKIIYSKLHVVVIDKCNSAIDKHMHTNIVAWLVFDMLCMTSFTCLIFLAAQTDR